MNQKECKKWSLGISYGHHESSCCLMSNEGDIYFVREEWLSRVKLDYRFPIQSINYLKKYLTDGVIDKVVHFQKPLKNWLSIGTEKKLSKGNYILKLRQFKKSDIFLENELKKIIGNKFDLHYSPHHLSHALSSSFFAKKCTNKLFLVLDGYGDGMSGIVLDSAYNEIQSFTNKQSLGLVYSALTEWAGFSPNEDEYKIMALAAYGKPIYFDFIQKELIVIEASGKIMINERYFNFTDISLSPLKANFFRKFGTVNSKNNQNYKANKDKLLCDVVCSFQRVIEDTVTKLIRFITQKFPNTKQLICSGGLFHNSVMVGVLEDSFKNIDISVPPCPGDGGSSLGAAFFGLLKLDKNFINMNMYDLPLSPFIGPKADSLEPYSNLFKKIVSNKKTLNFAKSLLESDHCFGVFDGLFEIGPRALGARSLITNADSKKAVKNLNEMIKQRESFRPLAIMLNEKKFKVVFNSTNINSSNLLWMGRVAWAKNNKQKYKFLHHDFSSRPQLVSSKTNSFRHIPNLLRNLIKDGFTLANTSFNIAGDPMVFSIEDLYINCIRMKLKFIYSDGNFYEVINENNI
mgnify:CR=1 FL=1